MVLVSIDSPFRLCRLLQLCGPTALLAVVIYGVLIWWHASQSDLTIEALSTQSQDEYGMPKSRWQQLTYRACLVIGVVLILLVLFVALRIKVKFRGIETASC